jgi:hypothetical protein
VLLQDLGRNRVFDAKYFVQTLNKGKKPGFFGAVGKSCFSVTGDGRGDGGLNFYFHLFKQVPNQPFKRGFSMNTKTAI